MAVRFAIAGNIIDFGVHSEIDDAVIRDTLDRAVEAHISDHSLCEFKSAVELAADILYLGDNAGEIVFDRLLIEQLPCEKVTYAVRGKPIINDATFVDAQFAGITELVEVIDNGSDAPGTLLDDCSQEFRARFEEADLILSKGQGNYESLSDGTGNIVFLLMAKCPVIARDIGYDVGSFVLKSGVPQLTVK